MVKLAVNSDAAAPRSAGPQPVSLPRIFVNVAAYRDSECRPTLIDLFAKARHPERIVVGVCWQHIPGEDDALSPADIHPEQCRIVAIDARDSRGVCWARAKVQELWRGEEYTLQIDSHMRFVQDWDDTLLTMLANCPSDRPVLSSYPPAYTPPDVLGDPNISVMFAREFGEDGVVSLHSRGISEKDAPTVPEANPFCAGGMLFARAEVIRDVPYDPHLYFLGEEITLSARLWTGGWDIFSPNRVVLYHDYTNRPGRRRHWNDHDTWGQMNRLAVMRIRQLFQMEEVDDADALREIDRYGLGHQRTLADYQAFSGIDFRGRRIGGKTQEEIEAEQPPAERRKRNTEAFSRIHRDNVWGATETRCGDGATLERTGAIRAELPRLFDFLGVRILADAGCGDLNWVAHISGGLRFYFGYDIVEAVIDDARRRVADRRNHFLSVADISLDILPEADAILCRDVLTHLPHWMVRETLRRFKESGSRYLIATTHQRGINDPIRIGGWQAIDLTAAPFNLPPPRLTVHEALPNSTKSLGVWHLADLP
ncbi:MAG: hypothetical protein M0006_06975 [Magnetospirillum sp.]|nr:hypothetical protein [Magnetospirillum sp.]